MRDLLNLLDILTEATLSAEQITRYPERFDAFIIHIQDGKAFYTTDGKEVVLEPSEANRFVALQSAGQFKGGLKGRGIDGVDYPLSSFLKTAEFGGSAAKPGDDTSQSKEGALVKPTQIGITDRKIQADKLADEIIGNNVLASTEYGRAVIAAAQNIVNGQSAMLPKELIKNEAVKKAIVDYAGEYLGVLALISNQTNFPNKKEFLNWLGGSFNELILDFPSKINTQIADSFASITNPNTQHQINISSKGTGGGAPPSLSGLVVPDSVRKKKAYGTAVALIDLCQDKGLPSPTTVSQVFAVMNLLNEEVPGSILEEFSAYLPWDISTITAQVRDSVKNGTPMPRYKELFADLVSKGSDGGKLTYVVKGAVLDAVNGGAVPEFQAAVLETLDYNFIQQYTKVENKSGRLIFDTQWPAKLNGEISLETKSGGTDPTKGGFSFKLKPTGGKNSIDDYQPDDVAPAKIKSADLDTLGQQRTRIKAAPEKLGSEKSLGRKRQH